MPPTEPLLEVQDITVSFDGFKAIQNLSLTVEKGSLRVLIGPNGAGKSTLLDTIIGKVRPAAATCATWASPSPACPNTRSPPWASAASSRPPACSTA